MMNPIKSLTAVALAAAVIGCAAPTASHDHAQAGAAAAKPAGMAGGMKMDSKGMMGMGGMHHGPMAMATLTPTQGNQVRGMVMFHGGEGHVMVHARITGLKPNAEHGFHVHEKGDCASADGTSAGGHFNPDGKPHGAQGADHHVGDMPNLKADANGVADQKFMLHGVMLKDGPSSIVARGVIVHANPDDFTTQPTGNSGGRIACGVVAAHG